MTSPDSPQQQEPIDAERILREAVSHHQAGRATDAERLYRDVLKVEPAHPDANHNYGVLALQSRQPGIAVRFLQTAVKARPDNGQYWVTYIDALIQAGQPEMARNVLQQGQQLGLKGDPVDKLIAQLSRILQPAQAPVSVDTSAAEGGTSAPEINKQPERSVSREVRPVSKVRAPAPKLKGPTQNEINDVIVFFNRGDVSRVEKLAREMTTRYPRHPFGWKALGAALQQQGRGADALLPKQKAAELLPGDPEVHNNLGVSQQEAGMLVEAEASQRRALALNPSYPEAWSNLGNALSEQGRFSEAEDCYRRAIELRPGFAEAYHYLGNCLREQGRFEEAGASLQEALRLRRDDAEAFDILGLTLQDQGRLTEAEAFFRRALHLQPNYADAHHHLGLALHEQGRLVDAEASYRRAVALQPTDVKALTNLGISLEEQDRLDDAKDCYRHVAEVKPDFIPAHYNLARVLRVQNRLDESVDVARSLLRGIAVRSAKAIEPGIARPITALLPFGRSGSMFFHSLFDGHPELSTLPGVYFKGWFGQYAWNRFAPDSADPKWRERLVAVVLREFEPLFDARSKKNVMGKPFDNATWLAQASGFMEMGPNKSQAFVVDRDAFAAALLALLAPLTTVGQRTCFELIHRAFDIGIRGVCGNSEGRQIFYHIHNPDPTEMAYFLHHYPEARLLYIVRQPVQAMESWMLGLIEDGTDDLIALRDAGASDVQKAEFLVHGWTKIVARMASMFAQLNSPFNTLTECRGVKLEDIKREAKTTMPKVAAWMGISDDPALYDASFCGLQYWGPASKTTGKISGFDTKAIDRPVGRLLGARDIMIFETLFWPLSRIYGYTGLDEQTFRRQLAEIRSWLDEPLEFESRFYADLPHHAMPLQAMPVYTRLHSKLKEVWTVLDREGTFHGMFSPLSME
ncbi:MAG TPA: tetratricopeptide repeat protein [Noviherbaspirillum sp.]|nr:tetratricopeptide repeat protein [Noviherbaspirillum sp.]